MTEGNYILTVATAVAAFVLYLKALVRPHTRLRKR
jgi:hypothetical protein